MAFCIHCGTKLGDSDRFCGTCGAKVEIAEPAPAAVPVESPAAPAATMIYTSAHPEEEAATAVPVAEEIVEAVPMVEEPAEKTAFSAPKEEELFTAPAAEEILPEEPLFAAPITREHVRTAATPAAAQPMPFGNKSARGSSASYSYATQERVTNPVQNKPVRPKRKFLAAFFSVILCLLLLTAMLPTYTLVTIRGAVTKKTFLSAMKRVELSELPATILDEYDSDLRGKSVAEALCDALNDELSVVYPEWDDITPKMVDQYLDESAFLPFIAEHAEGMLKAFVNGKTSYKIPTKQIVDLVEKDLDYLTNTLDIYIEEDVDPQMFADDIVNELDLDHVVLPNPAEYDEDTRLGLEVAGILLSFYPIAGCCVVLLLLVLLLFAANHRDPMYAIRDVGIVSVLGTILPLMMVFGARGAVGYFAGQKAEEYLVCLATSCVLDSTFPLVACVFGLGVVLLIVNGIVRGVQKKKANA